MNRRRATITDVAELAGVSIKTVSRVFNRLPNVRPSTREKVIAASEALNYRPNLSARQLASNLTFVIGMLYDNPNGDYVTAIQSGSIQICREYGYNLLIHPCNAHSENLINEVHGVERQVDGLILLQPLSDIDAICEMLAESDRACVRISQRRFGGLPRVSVDDAESAEAMTEYLLGLGHQRIGFVMGHPEHGSSHDRLNGYRAALNRHGIDVDSGLVEQGLFDYESGYSSARRLLSRAPRPTAIFASNDQMAIGVLSAAHESKLEIPGDLSVAGFDDSPWSRHAWPPLTTVRQPIEEVARCATELLMRRLRGNEEGESELQLGAELVHRASTGAPAA